MGRLDEIARARDFVAAVARNVGLSEKSVHHCALAVDETCTNIIEHGYQHQGHDKTDRNYLPRSNLSNLSSAFVMSALLLIPYYTMIPIQPPPSMTGNMAAGVSTSSKNSWIKSGIHETATTTNSP